jgi:hypothetical protein
VIVPLFIPYVNRFDLLEKAALSAVCDEVEINIIDNSDGPSIDIPGVDFFYRRPPVPLTFSQSQNWMLNIAEGDSDYDSFYLFMHSDAEAGEGTVKRLVEMARALSNGDTRWGCIFTAYDALAAFNTQAFREVGGWDTNLTWYAGDQDMYRRLRLAGYDLVESNLPVKHEPSQTIKSDPAIKRFVDIMVPYRDAYYRAKWGNLPGKETLTTPFNEGKSIFGI